MAAVGRITTCKCQQCRGEFNAYCYTGREPRKYCPGGKCRAAALAEQTISKRGDKILMEKLDEYWARVVDPTYYSGPRIKYHSSLDAHAMIAGGGRSRGGD